MDLPQRQYDVGNRCDSFLQTYGSAVRGKFILFEDDLVTVLLQSYGCIRGFSEYQVGGVRVTLFIKSAFYV